MFSAPAVSMPTARRTSTPRESMRLVFCIRTMEIMSGSPSGTAQTMMRMASETASITSTRTCPQPRRTYASMPPARRAKNIM